MKRGSRGWLAIAALCSGVSAAHAQSSVTLYGRVVGGVDYQTNVYDKATGKSSSLARAADNQWGTSMFGFRGEEDLGGGLKALFRLETGFGSSKGQTNGAAFFGRRSFVGLQSASLGTVLAGNNIAISNAIGAIDPTSQQFMGSATLVRGRSWQGHANMVSYETPNLGGFTALALTGFGEQAEGYNRLRKDALSLHYAAPSFELRAIYDVARDAQGRYTDLYRTSRNLVLGGTMTLDALKLFAAYERLSAPDTAAGQPDKAQLYWAGARYQVSSALTLVGAAYRTTVNKGGGRANLFMLGTDYRLSKRTLLYASVGTVQNSSNASFSVEATNNNPAPGKGQLGFYTGIAHWF